MKYGKLICVICLTVFLFTGCGQQAKMDYIGADKAKALALESAGISSADAEFTGTDMKNREGTDYYEICFNSEGKEYKYSIDALTGVVIDGSVPDSAGGDTDNLNVTQSGTEGAITEEQAKAKALSHAGLKESDVNFVKCKLDFDDGIRIYEVEFYSDNKEYDYEINAETGDIIKYDYDMEALLQSSGDSSASIISVDKAKSIALSQVPGATVDDIREFKKDTDDGRIEYEGKIIYNKTEYEFTIDGYSGAIREWEAEPFKIFG